MESRNILKPLIGGPSGSSSEAFTRITIRKYKTTSTSHSSLCSPAWSSRESQLTGYITGMVVITTSSRRLLNLK